MADAMVTARMSQEKKEAGNRMLEQLGTNASQAVNRLYDYVLENKKLPFPEEQGRRKYTQEEIADYRKFHAQNPDLYPDTDWLGMILKKNALRQSHALSITSAGKTTRTKISLGYDDVDGLFRKNLSWKRFTVRANNDIRLAKWLNVSLDLNMR